MFVVFVVFNAGLHQSSATAEMARSVAQRELSLSSGRCRSVTHFSSVISANINVNHLQPKTRFLGLNNVADSIRLSSAVVICGVKYPIR